MNKGYRPRYDADKEEDDEMLTQEQFNQMMAPCLSQQAITTILGVNALKVVENIFEHNSGGLFGKSE